MKKEIMFESVKLVDLIFETVPQSMRVIRATTRDAKKNDLTIPQLRILIFLMKNKGNLKMLSDWMGVRTSTASVMAQNLVKKGLIKKISISTDKRQQILSCTKKGRVHVQSAQRRAKKNIATKISALSYKEQVELKNGLNVLGKVFC